MNKGSTTNIVAVLAVVAVVACAAWFKSQRAQEPSGVPQVPSPAEKNEVAEEGRLPRLVDLGAHKCKQCIALAPILDALREEYEGRLSVEFIDVWKDPDAAKPYRIRIIPTQILYTAEGEEVWRHEGFISKEDLKALFAEKVGVQ
jgi:thioredoxin 1